MSKSSGSAAHSAVRNYHRLDNWVENEVLALQKIEAIEPDPEDQDEIDEIRAHINYYGHYFGFTNAIEAYYDRHGIEHHG